MSISSWRRYALPLSALVLLTSILYLCYAVARDDTIALLLVFSLAFFAYLSCYRLARTPQHIRQLLIVAVVARLALLPMMPNLSDDLYRFVWDGRLLYQGYDPFAYLPSEIMQGAGEVEAEGINSILFERLNSPDYYTIYPPVNQAVFALAAQASPHSVRGSAIVIRSVILVAELITLWLLTQLLRTAQRAKGLVPGRSPSLLGTVFRRAPPPPPHRVLLYALNPLVIIELNGKIHYEDHKIKIVLASVYLLRQQKLVRSGVALALAVCTKLVPLILLPLYWHRLSGRSALLLYFVVGISTAVLFFPLVTPELIAGMRDSVGLYFQKFEFNASVYYLIRAYGFYDKGYNIIAQAGRWLAVSTFVGIMLYAAVERNRYLPAAFSGAWLIFLLLSTTVHPWYVVPLLAFTMFAPYQYAVLWSGLIFFSYAGYTTTGFSENLWITTIEYVGVLGLLGYELMQRVKRRRIQDRPPRVA